MFNKLSIKWKLSVSFVGLSLGLVSLYIAMAKNTFESDRIFYIFDSEQAQLESLSHDINQQIERTLFDSRSILAGFDFATKKLSTLGENLFQEQKNLLAVEMWESTTSTSIMKITKDQGLLTADRVPTSASTDPTNSISIQVLPQDRFLLTTSQRTATGEILQLRVVAEFQNVLPKSPTGHVILSQNDVVINESGKVRAPSSVVREIVTDLAKDRSEKTSIQSIQGKEYFISTTPLKYGALRVSSVVAKEEALSALNTLYQRSLVFLVFAGLITILLAFWMSSKLTEQLRLLTIGAEKIGQGDFSGQSIVRSNDEVGILSKAFSRMSVEIERLIVETKDKARMEQELATAKIVQDNLFPKDATYKSGDLELSGLYVTSSECGGDWWYYFERGDDLFILIADATGHGTPAALLTSAARSLFSQIEVNNSSLKEMASQWDRAIASCSKQTRFMTALLLQVNRSTGLVTCLNASHELPYLLRKEENSYSCEPVMIPPGHRLGEDVNPNWEEVVFSLKAGDRLVLFTDGLISIPNAAGKELRDRTLIKSMIKISDENLTGAQQFCTKVFDVFQNHVKEAPLLDDVTLVVLERQSA